MRNRHITSLRATRQWLMGLMSLCCLFAFFNLTCNGDNAIVVPPGPYDPLRPTIESFVAQRDGDTITDDIVFSGEDILLVVGATSQAFPQSCGLDEGETVEGNLLYTFESDPPNGVPAPGLLSQSSPPSNRATWRIPNLDAYDSGEGLLYTLLVRVYDECLGTQASGNLTLRAFANMGPPIISQTVVQSDINTASPVTELLDQNNLYEVERSDECRISVTAQSRTSDEVCANRGVPTGDELEYVWTSTRSDINLTCNQDPTRATTADFDIPITIGIGGIFQVECTVTDACTDTRTVITSGFIAVGAPRINNITALANWQDLEYDPYFDTYDVLHADEIRLRAYGEVMDEGICDMKGISPDLEWAWTETSGSTPILGPYFDPLPSPYTESAIEFVIPAASNGTEYLFNCTVTDRCNGLTDVERLSFTVIIYPEAEITSVMRGTTVIQISPASGRYEVQAADLITVRISASAASGTGFCESRGVSMSPPVQYYWPNPWGDQLVLNYDEFPTEPYCELVFVIPGNAPSMDANMTCRVKDLCNELVTEVVVPYRIG